MDYIKDTISTTSIAVCIMESHQAGQQDALVEVRVEEARLGAAHRPRCLNCAVALATVMGLVILALVAGFIFYFFTAASCNQDSHARAEFNVTCNPNKSDGKGRYDICTVNKSANYLIYGVVTSPTSNEVSLMQSLKKMNGPIQKSDSKDNGEFIFLKTVNLINGTKISINFKSTSWTSCHFLVFRL